MSKTYDIVTDLDPQSLNAVGLAVYQMWVRFALGQSTLGEIGGSGEHSGFRIQNPTSTYAASITHRMTGQSTFTIAQDETAAPEGEWLEEGHKAIDMTTIPGYRGKKLSRAKMTANRGKTIHAIPQGGSDYVTVPLSRASIAPGRRNTSGTDAAWMIPAMPAYSPAGFLAELASDVARSGWRR